ncbi:hypothetical protein KORDIASMS9_03134 [Kordia sp. SMS9]|uniref:hypothetical protein n=1 Tax=Kordia sp. SMS9 TaxID=2282170 RepID=UPI000E0D77E0|nr:hypothetical protein [Kordia sp. SMS9]AXG70884.1 hypothetical protein KORDIASMS9_03134 [Kordia sp. SMS9]
MFHKNPEIGQELLNVPMGEMIEKMATSIANAQMALDSNSIEVAEMMGGLSPVKSTINGKEFINFKDSRVFFGKEKLQLADAVELYNANSDGAYKASIQAKFLSGETEPAYDKEVVDVDLAPTDNAAKFTPDNQKNGDVFYRKTPTDWFKYNVDDGIYESMTTPTASTTQIMVTPGTTERTIYVPQRLSMLELGFAPTFYQFVDTILKVTLSIKFTREGSSSYKYESKSKSKDRSASFSWRRGLKTNKTVTTTQVNAGFSQKYSYSAEGSSLLQTKLVPIPPPAALEERIQQQMAIAREEEEN